MTAIRNPLTLLLGIFLLFPFYLPAQGVPSHFMLPPTIFVGDPGRVVVLLDEAFAGVEPFVLENPGNLPERPDLLIRRIELERRGGIVHLLIDFVPFAPGPLAFPPLEFAAAGEEPLTLSGLQVQVASVLNPAWMDLSGPAPPLAVPGTGLLVYGSIALILLVLFLGIAASIWSKRHFRNFWQRLYRRHLIRAILKFLRRLGQESGAGKEAGLGQYLSLLASEFREFLSAFTGFNCRSLTPAEFMELPLTHDAAVHEPLLTAAFLSRLFRSWDILRFSGRDIARDDLAQALNDAESFILALSRAEKENTHAKPALKLAGESAAGEGL